MSEFYGSPEDNNECNFENNLNLSSKQSKIVDIFNNLNNMNLMSGTKIKVCGWIRTVRTSGAGFSFCSLN